MKESLTFQDIENIKHWYKVKSGESSCEVEEIGTLLKFGIRDRVRHGRKFKHDCKMCIFLGPESKDGDPILADYDVFYCTGTGSLVIRFGSNGPDYWSGKPSELEFIIEQMKKNNALPQQVKIFGRALLLFSKTGIEEEKGGWISLFTSKQK